MKLLESMANSESGVTIAERPKNRLQPTNIKTISGNLKVKNESNSANNNNNNTISQKDFPKEGKTNGVVNIGLAELTQSQNNYKSSNNHRANNHRNYSQNGYCSYPNQFYQNQSNNRRNNFRSRNGHRGASPNHSTGSASSGGSSRYTPSPQSQNSGHSPHSPRGNSPNYHNRYKDGSSNQQAPGSSNSNVIGNSHLQHQQHVVHLHVNPGEAISFQMGDQLQLISGPATVRMVSNNNTPPMPMPVQVPPGHMVQQIVDETGTLRHVILSPQPLTMQMGTPGPYTSTNQSSVPGGGGGSSGAASPVGHYYNYPPCTAGTGYPNQQYHHIPMQTPESVQQSRNNNMTSSTSHNVLPNGKSCPHHSSQSQVPNGNSLPNHKDERTQKQFHKLKKKLDARQKDSPTILTSHKNTSSPSSPKKDVKKFKDRNTSTSGLGDDAGILTAEEEEEQKTLTELLSQISQPTVHDIGSRNAHVSWKPPKLNSENGENKYVEFDVKESDFCYEISILCDKSKDSKYKVVYNGSNLECELQNLKPATDYHSKLQALLDNLKGQQTEAVTFRTLSSKPDTPNPPKLSSRTKTTLSLKWNPPADNGSKLSGYVLEFDNGTDGFTEVFNGLSKQFKVTKLSTSTCYKFRLMCINALGKSEYSEVVSYSTSGSVPNQPAPPSLTSASVNKLSLSWQKRPNDEDFTLQIEEEEGLNHGFLPVYNGPECSYTCTGLNRNTKYKFRLSANNEEGSSRWSDVTKYKTLPDRPSCPGKPYVKGRVHSTSFKVTWDAPKDDGGSSITCYHLEMDKGNDVHERIYSNKEQEHVCDNLKPGTVYRLRVSCSSDGGNSEFSEIGCITTLPVSPGQCAIPKLNGKPKAHSLQLKWAYPEYDGGTTVTDYEVDMTSPDNCSRSVYKGQYTECAVAGLLPGRPYIFRVRAFNRIGAGEWSDLMEAVSGAGVPDSPKDLAIVYRSAQHAVISWEEPLNNGATVSEYRLEWTQQQGSRDFVQLYTGSNMSYDIKGLQPATEYNFRIQAINSAGPSSHSEVLSTVTPPSSPATVQASSIKMSSIDANSCKLTWMQPVSNGADITSYIIELSCGSSARTITVQSPIETEHTLQNLQPLTSYRIRIQAVNSVGVGPFSSTLKITTKPLPPLPPKMELIGSTHNSLKIRWSSDIKQNSVDLIQYCLEMQTKPGSYTPIYVGVNHSHKISKLSEDSEYVFRIAASNEAGQGPYSEDIAFCTSKAPPPAPKAPRVVSVSESSCDIEWSPLAKQVPCDEYEYQLQILINQTFKMIYRGTDTHFTAENLKSNTEYVIRVNCVRIYKDDVGELPGAFSPNISFLTASKEPVKPVSSSNKLSSTFQSSSLAAMVTDRKPLTDQQWAMIILFGFTLFAILVAIVLQRVIAYSNKAPS